jgi:uncharacterized protein YrrD
MKRKLQLIISASAASVLAFSALAQETTIPTSDQTEHLRDRQPDARRADRLNGAAKASEVIGMTVKNNQDEKLGKVEDLAVDVESGRIVQVILSTGGFLGIGDTLTAVPPGALHHDVASKVLHLDADKEKLKNAPKFETTKWAEYSDSEHLSAVYRHYGEEPAFTFTQTNGSPNISSTRKQDGTWDKDRISNQDQSMIPTSRLSLVQKGSKVIGISVKNLQEEKLGKVENLLVDLSSGRIVAVIVSAGGFIGIGDELSAVPPTALRYTADRETLQLDVSKDMLSNSPHFKANQWPDFSEPTYAGEVYRAYKVEPYFAVEGTSDMDNNRHIIRERDARAGVPTAREDIARNVRQLGDRPIGITNAADNTARNVRDRDSQTLTPLDQGNSQADINTTAEIRKEVIANKAMSVNARNVKIITNNGQVTLRGPVNSAEEKRVIGQIADRIARTGNVDNQLEVKITTTSN